MLVDITGRHMDITPPLRQLIDRSLGKIERLLNDRAVSATVILTKEKYRHKTELVVHARGDHMLSGNGEGNGWPLSVRKATAKIEQQARKLKSRWTEDKRQRDGTGASAAGAVSDLGSTQSRRPVVRTARYPVKPMSVEDAALRLEAGQDTFVVFRNAETDAVGILYRRKDGNLALIEPD
ncbi:MAG TPA: ribosome-associated translation inhibitor RaiA [Vicinamibacterales bacterium]|jgi:putative sigma-54 modulation protein|nr:ribosome-associated translation inhibitor RaiA [Vicinamibacterales bacterium]